MNITPQEQSLIIESWDLVLKIGIDPVGKILFENIFKLAPQAKDLYSFKDLPNLF